jgi:predicted ester cyclase
MQENTLEQNKALMQRWFDEVWNKGRTDAIDEMMAADAVAHGLSDDVSTPLIGPVGFKPFHEKFCGAFPNIEVIVEDMIAEGDKVAARCSVRGRHTGDQLGVAVSNATVEFTGIYIVLIRDGKFIVAWNNFDFLKMNKQIGAI